MKNLVMTALLCAGIAPLATGCIITSDPDPDPVVGGMEVTWSLVSGDLNEPAACPDGATTIALYSIDSLNEEWTDLFDCAAGGGVTGDLPPDLYYSWVELQDSTGAVLYAQSLGADVEVAAGFDTPITFEFSIDRGAFDVAWEVYDGVDLSSCENVGATAFSLDYTDSIGEFFGPDLFACADYAGTTPVMRLDAWTVSPSIIDASELALAVGASIDTALEYGNHYLDLGVVALDVQAP